MGDKRRLQCDIDRTLKRVQEGRAAFQEILDKFEASSNQTQKEKYENDLKKEIKRLQRFRDQIKTWITSNEIKDKRQLEEARRLIEQDMERFKVIEKETKTKAYSKEGLLSADIKKDPLQKEKEELDDWLKQSICTLNQKVEAYEYELETLSSTGRKKRADREKHAQVEEKKLKLQITLFHTERLETVLRLLDNECLETSKVRELREAIDFAIESIDEANPGDDYKSLYDELHLDDLGDKGILTPSAISTPAFIDIDTTPTPVASTKPSTLDNLEPTTSPSFIQPLLHHSPASSNASSSLERSKAAVHEEKTIVTPPTALSASTPIKEKKEKTKASLPALNQTAPPSVNLTTTLNKKSFAGAAAAKQQQETPRPEPTVQQQSEQQTIAHRENYAKVAGESKKEKGKKESQQQQNQQTTEHDAKPETRATKGEKRKTEDLKVVHDASAAAATVPSAANSSSPRNAAPIVAETSTSIASTASKNPLFTVAPTSTAEPSSQQQQLSEQNKNGPRQMVCVNPRDALAPFRNRQLDQNRFAPPELKHHLQSLECAYRRMPQPTDLSRARMLITKRPAITPSYYPSEPMRNMDSEQYFMSLDASTLFFIFYYLDGTKAQYLAAKALKKMSWRFHTKYMFWFQRNEEPKQITDEYESGAYLYFDYPIMRQLKKDEFLFEYKYLEDNELVAPQYEFRKILPYMDLVRRLRGGQRARPVILRSRDRCPSAHIRWMSG
ncbi:hypothetical protein ACTXT7_002050 [Hymenolepis weldensis]